MEFGDINWRESKGVGDANVVRKGRRATIVLSCKGTLQKKNLCLGNERLASL